MSRLIINALAAAIAISGAVVSSNVAWSKSAEPVERRAYVTRAEFDQAFADVAAASRSGNTPATREKLRDLGWKRLIPPIASKPIASKPIASKAIASKPLAIKSLATKSIASESIASK